MTKGVESGYIFYILDIAVFRISVVSMVSVVSVKSRCRLSALYFCSLVSRLFLTCASRDYCERGLGLDLFVHGTNSWYIVHVHVIFKFSFVLEQHWTDPGEQAAIKIVASRQKDFLEGNGIFSKLLLEVSLHFVKSK